MLVFDELNDGRFAVRDTKTGTVLGRAGSFAEYVHLMVLNLRDIGVGVTREQCDKVFQRDEDHRLSALFFLVCEACGWKRRNCQCGTYAGERAWMDQRLKEQQR